MIEALNFVLLLLGLLIFVPVLVLFTQVIASLLSFRKKGSFDGRPRIAVLVPAHDESPIIRRTIESIRSQLLQGERLLVVADNCTDNTAAVAAAAGAEVTERRDPARIGKGYALDHGVKVLKSGQAPEIVVFLDADCEIGAGTLNRIAQISWASGRPVQAHYIMQSMPSAGALERISRFAWTVKTLVRPLGYSRLGLPCQLMGTGMAFPWSVIQSVDLATGHLVEDLKLGADLAVLGKAPLFCPEATVTSWFPPGEEGRRVQRTRWEHGHFAMMSEYVPRLMWHGMTQGSLSLLALALDLSVPPLALLGLLIISVECVTLLWLAFTGLIGPVLMSTGAAAVFGASLAIAWWRFGRNLVSLRDLVVAPVYFASKIPTFLRFFTGRQIAWIRSRRQ